MVYEYALNNHDNFLIQQTFSVPAPYHALSKHWGYRESLSRQNLCIHVIYNPVERDIQYRNT